MHTCVLCMHTDGYEDMPVTNSTECILQNPAFHIKCKTCASALNEKLWKVHMKCSLCRAECYAWLERHLLILPLLCRRYLFDGNAL